MFNNSTILITGGTGSFGRKYTEIILEKFQPKKIIIFLGLYFFKSTSVYFFPKDPVPPVIKIVELLNIFFQSFY